MTILASLILAITFCAIEAALAWLPVAKLAVPHNALLTADGLFYVLSTALLYWSIVLCLRHCEDALYVATGGQSGQRKFYQAIIHPLLFSLRVVLAATDIGLKVLLNAAASHADVSQSAEESVSFDMSAVFLLAMVVDVFVSTLLLRRAMQEACVNTRVRTSSFPEQRHLMIKIYQFINVLLYAVTPLYGVNASSHIIDFVQDLTKLHVRGFKSFVLTMARDIIVNISFVIIIAVLLWELPPLEGRSASTTVGRFTLYLHYHYSN